MRLVGASNLFIQLPFLLEAILATVLGAVIAIGTLWALTHFAVQGWLAQKMQFIPFVDGGGRAHHRADRGRHRPGDRRPDVVPDDAALPQGLRGSPPRFRLVLVVPM